METVLYRAGCSIEAVSRFLPHQPNGPLLQAFCNAMGIGAGLATAVVEEVGSTGAASVALALDRLWRSGRVRRGELLLFVAVGAGTSRGALLYQTAS